MRRRSKHHSFEEISAVLSLDPETGQLWWRKKTGPRCDMTKPAGTPDKTTGYIIVQVLRRPYKAHRLVWLLHTGNWPKEEIDHINRIKNDNRPVNLRNVSKGENQLNNPYTRGLTRSGVVGVYPMASGWWQAQLQGRTLGTFPTKELARQARERAYDAR